MNKTPWMVASLLAMTSIFGQNQNQGSCAPQQCVPRPPVCKPAKCCTPQQPMQPTNCAYNAPAEINVGCVGDIDIETSVSFLYWQPSQDNMAVGFTSSAPIGLAAAQALPQASIQGSFIDMDFDFKPGFKVGLGMNLQMDDWDGYAEYTRVHGWHSVFSNGNGPVGGVPAIFSTFSHPYLNIGQVGGMLFNTVFGSYRNNLDFVDAEMGRTYYVGKSLIFRSAFGARAAWMLQNVHVRYNNTTAAATVDASNLIVSLPSVLDVYQRAHSWGVGPRTGLMMDWMLGAGFRFFGSGYGDILYTKYKVQDKSVLMPRAAGGGGTGSTARVGVPVTVNGYEKVFGLRTHLDLEMGFGWGSYFSNKNWHFDLSFAYGWQVFFDQAMFRHFTSASEIGAYTNPNGNMYIQGLTLTARLDW